MALALSELSQAARTNKFWGADQTLQALMGDTGDQKTTPHRDGWDSSGRHALAYMIAKWADRASKKLEAKSSDGRVTAPHSGPTSHEPKALMMCAVNRFVLGLGDSSDAQACFAKPSDEDLAGAATEIGTPTDAARAELVKQQVDRCTFVESVGELDASAKPFLKFTEISRIGSMWRSDLERVHFARFRCPSSQAIFAFSEEKDCEFEILGYRFVQDAHADKSAEQLELVLVALGAL